MSVDVAGALCGSKFFMHPCSRHLRSDRRRPLDVNWRMRLFGVLEL